MKLLFEKHIDLSSPRHRHIAKALKEMTDFETALKFVAKNMILTDYIIAKLREDAPDFTEEDAKDVEKEKEDIEEKTFEAREEADRIKRENKADGEAARSQK